jgi:hypothetical protein
MEGRRLLESPLQQFLALDHDFGFCINWANESWSRRWDGSDQEVLMAQNHSLAADIAFFKEALPLFRDPRYLTVGGKPLLLVYRVPALSQPREVFARWREMAVEAGWPGVHIAMVESFGHRDPVEWTCDSSVQFPPHNVRDLLEPPIEGLRPGFRGKVFDYTQVVAHALAEPEVRHRRYPGLMLAWDNSARRGDDAHIYSGFEPGTFELWLEHSARHTEAQFPEGERYVFINAWNEWSEGSYLEPDYHWGRAALEAVRAVVFGQAGPATHLALLRRALQEQPALVRSLDTLASQFAGLQRSLDYSLYLNRSHQPLGLPSGVSLTPPFGIGTVVAGGQASVDSLAQLRNCQHVQISRGGRLTAAGWALPGDRPLSAGSLSFLKLRARAEGGPSAYALVNQRQMRADVQSAKNLPAELSLWSGWGLEVELASLPPGHYQLSMLFPPAAVGSDEVSVEVPLNCTLEVLP